MKIKIPHLAGLKLALNHMVISLKRGSTSKASGENQKAPAICLIKDHNAFYNGSQAALNGSNQPLKNELISRNYSNIAADNYIKGFGSKVACHITQAARQASRAGYQAARMGLSPLTLQQQLRKGFTKEQSIAYVKAYDKCAGCPETQMNRKVKLAGYQAAKYGSKRPSNLKLSLRGYTPNHITIYYQSYDSSLDTPEG